MPIRRSNTLTRIYDRLIGAFGPQGWWPVTADPADGHDRVVEIVVSAILTQNTAWRNVERAITNVRDARLLSWSALDSVAEADLARVIRPAGTYRVKARRVKAFARYVHHERNDGLEHLCTGDLECRRAELLSIHGIGPETADAILLYAIGLPSFVVDAYTGRVLRRHGVIDPRDTYDQIRRRFHEALPADAELFNEYHALLVAVGKRYCRTQARCTGCPLSDLPHDADG